MQHSLKLKKGYTIELSSWLSTASIQQGTFVSKAMGFVDIGVQKQIVEGKGNIKLSVSDIFKTMRWQGYSNFRTRQYWWKLKTEFWFWLKNEGCFLT